MFRDFHPNHGNQLSLEFPVHFGERKTDSPPIEDVFTSSFDISLHPVFVDFLKFYFSKENRKIEGRTGPNGASVYVSVCMYCMYNMHIIYNNLFAQ